MQVFHGQEFKGYVRKYNRFPDKSYEKRKENAKKRNERTNMNQQSKRNLTNKIISLAGSWFLFFYSNLCQCMFKLSERK